MPQNRGNRRRACARGLSPAFGGGAVATRARRRARTRWGPRMSKTRKISLVINGKRYDEEVEVRFTLADFMLQQLGLTGTHLGCEHGVCGACTILSDNSMPPRFDDIGHRLKAFRLGSGLSAEEVANRIGISRTALYRFEKGEVVKIDTLEKLAELLEVSLPTLLGVGVEYIPSAVTYFERMRQIQETPQHIVVLAAAGASLSPPVGVHLDPGEAA